MSGGSFSSFTLIHCNSSDSFFCESMNNNEKDSLLTELDDADRAYITDLFYGEIASKLQRLGARLGAVNCGFAGRQYINWVIHFRSAGSGFNIMDFEYDEEGAGLDLDL